MPKFEAVLFDMDGTLVDGPSSWAFVHASFGVDNDDTLQEFLRGAFDEMEFVRRDIRKWKRAGVRTRKEIQDLLEKPALIPGARALVDELRRSGTKTALVTGGLDILAERVCRETGIEHYLANGVHFAPDGTLLEEGFVNVPVLNKGEPARRLLAEWGVAEGTAAAVGNSRQDIPMFRVAGFGVAFNPEDADVVAAANVSIRDKNLRKLIPHLVGEGGAR